MLRTCLSRPVATALLVAAAALFFGCESTPTSNNSQKYMFWPQVPEVPRVQYLRSFASSEDITGKNSKFDEMLYGKDAQAGLEIQRPYGVRMHDGKIYICDASGVSVTVLDLRKKEVRLLGTKGAGQLSKPIDIAVASDGTKYVADTAKNRVFVYDVNDNYVGAMGHPDLRPVSLAIRGNELLVANIKGSKIEIYDRATGKFVSTFGSKGIEKGQLGGVFGISVDKAGNVYANDLIGCRVQKFSPDGEFLMTFGAPGRRPGTFARPKHMAVDSEGIIYVVDAAFQNVQLFNDKGQLLMDFGGPGDFPGNMDMPAGIAVHEGDLDLFQPYAHPDFKLSRVILVSNGLGPQKVTVYGLGQPLPGKSFNAQRLQFTPDRIDPTKEMIPDAPTTLPSPATAPAMPHGHMGPAGTQSGPAAPDAR